MARDIRDLFEQERQRSQPKLSEGHEDRFLQKLEDRLPHQPSRSIGVFWIRGIAAAVIFLLVSWSVYYFWQNGTAQVPNTPTIVEQAPPVNTPPIENHAIEEVAVTPEEAPKTNQRKPRTNQSPAAVEKPQLTLSDLSPDLKKVETYFISSINAELASLDTSEEEQEMVDAYLVQIEKLGKEYDNLNYELNTIGVNDMTITALIENLKMRLQLLHRLKKNLNHSKKENHGKKSSGNI